MGLSARSREHTLIGCCWQVFSRSVDKGLGMWTFSSNVRSDKGKPIVRRGRKATGQSAPLMAGLPKSKIHSEVGLPEEIMTKQREKTPNTRW